MIASSGRKALWVSPQALPAILDRALPRPGVPRTFGPVIRHKLAEHEVALVDEQRGPKSICAPANALECRFHSHAGRRPTVSWSPSYRL